MKPIKAKWLRRFVTDRKAEEIPCIVYGFATSCDRPVAIVKFEDIRTLEFVSVKDIEIESELTKWTK
jgi:hypothetical protein